MLRLQEGRGRGCAARADSGEGDLGICRLWTIKNNLLLHDTGRRCEKSRSAAHDGFQPRHIMSQHAFQRLGAQFVAYAFFDLELLQQRHAEC